MIWSQRAIPLYWEILHKKGSSNLQEQQNLITPVLSLLQDYQIIILGDREFGSVKLAKWLCEVSIKFVLRVKQERYIQSEKEEYQHLSQLGLMPGTGFNLSGVKVSKQKGFGFFDVAGYWKIKYRTNGSSEGWYLLTNVGSLKLAIASLNLGVEEKLCLRIVRQEAIIWKIVMPVMTA